jgi:hypothetical protein
LFAEFAGFFRQRQEELAPDRLAALGVFVSECMASGDVDLDNAAATCFIESIAREPCDRDLARHLTGEAREYFRAWGGRS